jgi:hypothetical protein
MKLFLLPVAIGIIVGLATHFSLEFYKEWKNRIQHLEYYSSESSDILRSIREIGDSVNFVVNARSINNLSELGVYFLNNSNRDLENVPVYIDLYYASGEDLPIFTSNFYDHNGYKESIEEIKDVSPSKFKGGKRYGYNIKVVNRSSEPVFIVRYLIEGTSVPRFEVHTDAKGLSARKFVPKDEAPSDIRYLSSILALTVGIITVMIVSQITTYLKMKEKGKLAKEFSDEINQHRNRDKRS